MKKKDDFIVKKVGTIILYHTFLNRGGVYFVKGFHEEAMEDFSRAMSLAPKATEIY